MAIVELKNINQGGLADSLYSGLAESVAEMVGIDLHNVPGLIRVNQKLTKDSGDIIDDLAKARVSCSDESTYFFGSTNGKVWQRDSNGGYTLQATVAPSSGAIGVTGAAEYEGYIYYAMQSSLGRWQIGTAWSTRDDNFATFTNGDADFHPMRVLNLVLYIGDGNLIAQVDNSTGTAIFSANALDVYMEYRIKCLGQLNTDLLIGTVVSSNVVQTSIFRWNTWSVSFTSSDPIPEDGINAFLETDNYVIVNAGTKGKLYLYNGSTLDNYQQLPGTWDPDNKGAVNPNAVFNFYGIPLFGMSTISGNPCRMGLYSVARSNRKYPFVLNMDYPVSERLNNETVFSNIEIGCITSIPEGFLVSWKNIDTGEFGIDRLDLNNKYEKAFITSRAIIYDRMRETSWTQITAGYRILPDGTSINLYRIVNYGDPAPMDATVDKLRSLVYTDNNIGSASVVQARIEMNAVGNDAPEIDVVQLKTSDAQ